MIFRKKTKYHMDVSVANDAFLNILEACEQPPSSLPVDKILLRQRIKLAKYNSLIVLTGLILFLTFIAPLCAIPFQYSGTITPSQTHSAISLTGDALEGDVLTLTFEGKGILFEEAYLQLTDGTVEKPLSYDTVTGTVCFTYYNTDINIYIPVENAPVYHLLISPK